MKRLAIQVWAFDYDGSTVTEVFWDMEDALGWVEAHGLELFHTKEVLINE